MIQTITIILCGILFTWGGYNFLVARRFILPVILCASSMYLCHSLIPLLMLLSCLPFSLGYGDNSVLRHIFGNGCGRGVWGLLVGLLIGISLVISGHVYWEFFLFYLALSFSLEDLLKDINQLSGDFIIGCGFGSIVIFIH